MYVSSCWGVSGQLWIWGGGGRRENRSFQDGTLFRKHRTLILTMFGKQLVKAQLHYIEALDVWAM
jgi:hypothetical protein